jgi:hypothetical protein
VPILPFYDDQDDEELIHLVHYVDKMSKSEDVRMSNREAFQLVQLQDSLV